MAKGWVLRGTIDSMLIGIPNVTHVYYMAGGGLTSMYEHTVVFGSEHAAEYANDRHPYRFDVVTADQAEAEYVAQRINE